MPTVRFRIAIHERCFEDLKNLADRGLRFENSIGRAFNRIDELFGELDAQDDTTAMENWALMPAAVPGMFKELDLRCIDPPDGLITVIARVQDDVLHLLSADLSTRAARQKATQRAAERGRSLDWADPE